MFYIKWDEKISLVFFCCCCCLFNDRKYMPILMSMRLTFQLGYKLHVKLPSSNHLFYLLWYANFSSPSYLFFPFMLLHILLIFYLIKVESILMQLPNPIGWTIIQLMTVVCTKHFKSNMEVLISKIAIEKCSFQYFDVKENSHLLLGQRVLS